MSKGLKIGVSALALMMAATAAQQAAASDWTGLYAGVHVGYGKGEASDSLACDYWDYNNPGQTLSGLVFGSYFVPDNTFVNYCDYYGYGGSYITSKVSETYDYYDNYTYDGLDDFSGFLIGGQAGYLYQNGSFVLGAEVSASGASISDTSMLEQDFMSYGRDDVQTQLNVDWLASAVVRAGFVPTDNVLVSANVGLATAGTHFRYDGVNTGSWNDSAVASGWTAGAQVDYMLTDTISVFGAYSYTQLYDLAYSGVSQGSFYEYFPLTFNYEYDLGIHAIKVGVNNHFN